MGLAVEVGIFAEVMENDPDAADHFRESFNRINAALADAGLPQHHEPETPPALLSRCSCLSYPYSHLHHLRCVYAHFEADPKWRPVAGEKIDLDDPILERSYKRTRSHLILHSDCEGYYVPLDFDDVIKDKRVPGGILGSSYRLRDELVAVAPVLEIKLHDGELSDVEAARVMLSPNLILRWQRRISFGFRYTKQPASVSNTRPRSASLDDYGGQSGTFHNVYQTVECSSGAPSLDRTALICSS